MIQTKQASAPAARTQKYPLWAKQRGPDPLTVVVQPYPCEPAKEAGICPEPLPSMSVELPS